MTLKRLTQPAMPVLAGFSHRRSYFREDPVRHQEHEINVSLSGEAVYHLDGKPDVPLRAGEILLLPGGTRHAIEVALDFHMAVIHVHPDVLKSLNGLSGRLRSMAASLQTWTSPPPHHKVMLPDINQRLEWLTEDVILEQSRQEVGREGMLRVLAAQTGMYFLRLMLAPPADLNTDEAARRIGIARGWIDRHFMEPCSIDWLAGMARLAPTYFAARFRELAGVPPMTYVRQLRLKQARHLLEQTDEPVKVVAWNVGYPDVSHFNRVFKQHVRQTPSQYRLASQSESPKS